jgi:uncharacterized membrane protein YgdD (TMEM256/DUF423 family)
MKKIIAIGATLMFIGVALGAFGAHALKPYLLLNQMSETWQTAVDYHLWHGISLLVLATLYGQSRQQLYLFAAWIMLIGIIFFSGSLYLLAFSGFKFLTMITPLGGVILLSAWALVLWTTLTR